MVMEVVVVTAMKLAWSLTSLRLFGVIRECNQIGRLDVKTTTTLEDIRFTINKSLLMPGEDQYYFLSKKGKT